MNIPAIKNPVVRRLHFLWIIPYLIIVTLPMILYEGGKELLPSLPGSLRDVWTGR